MHLHLFARFHAAPGQEDRMAGLLRERVPLVQLEPGCLSIQACRSRRDLRQFFLHSCWIDEPAFQVHADLPATETFIARMESMSDVPVEVHRSSPVDAGRPGETTGAAA